MAPGLASFGAHRSSEYLLCRATLDTVWYSQNDVRQGKPVGSDRVGWVQVSFHMRYGETVRSGQGEFRLAVGLETNSNTHR